MFRIPRPVSTEGAARLSLALLVPVSTGVIWALRRLDPNAADSLLPACPFLSLTGLYCPGCGSTRCLHALAHLDLGAAFSMNPLLVLALPALTLMLVWSAGLRPPALAPVMRVLGNARGWLWVLLGFGVLRNLPLTPFSALAPG